MIKHFTKIQLVALNRMRERFLNGTAGAQDYWRFEEDLALYDSTFGERIGWKWDAVLRELGRRGWAPQSVHAIDWGCGTGIAGRRALTEWPQLKTLALHDRSPLALRYATDRARESFPGVEVHRFAKKCEPNTLLLVSHVANELTPAALEELLALAAQARDVVWVEAGTHADSRRLSEIRERLLAGGFTVVAPCTHQARCGMLTPENERHWCHHFAGPPPEAFQDARWAEYGKELSIDLRSLPYSFFVLSRAAAPPVAGFSRVIGEVREAKGYCKVLSCQAEGVSEFMLQKRDAPELHRELRKGHEAPIYRWTVDDGKIKGGEPLPVSGVETPPDHA
ncbi:MAG: small ribosomal subunit Rsm22 family protein [Chthoniobacteraceae bacterium]